MRSCCGYIKFLRHKFKTKAFVERKCIDTGIKPQIINMQLGFDMRDGCMQQLCCVTFSSMIRVCSHTSQTDRKSTRLNSSHVKISYAVFCLKKKKNKVRLRCLY